MNVIVSNAYTEMLTGLNIDVIKSINGEFEVEEIISTFKNFFFNRMILDITAIKDYKDFSKIQKLSMNIDMNKVILLLDDSMETSSPVFLSKLISVGIYNFTKTTSNIVFLMDNPNTYKDVAEYHHLSGGGGEVSEVDGVPSSGPIVIGFKNLTVNAGATSLVYKLKRQLVRNYQVVAIEVGKNDFVYFDDKDLISIGEAELGNNLAKYGHIDVILIDLNNFNDDSLCNEVIYLIEPSTIKLNKMIKLKPGILGKLKNMKIVLNKSLLSKKDVSDFEFESKSTVFFNIPPLDDRESNHKFLDNFLLKLGFSQQIEEGTSTGGDANILKGIFKGKV